MMAISGLSEGEEKGSDRDGCMRIPLSDLQRRRQR